MIRKQKVGAAVITTATPNATNINMINDTTRHIAESSPKSLKKLAGEVAGLLFYLQNPLSQHQRQKTWHIFELKLRQYLDLKVREVPL